MNYSVTYDDALEICKQYNNFHFSEHQYKIDGFKISTFDYFICGWNDFEKPLPKRPEVNAFDMRGVTFVFDEEGKYKKFLMLPKFFNLNQVDSTQYDKVKTKKIKYISYKEDGSLVAFMMLPNGKLFSKTIAGFSNEQCETSLKLLYEWEDHVVWIKSVLNLGFTPLFEYVSWNNRIVLKYSKTNIRLIGIRNNDDGRFIPIPMIEKETGFKIPYHMVTVNEIKSTLDELIEISKTKEDVEGWVIMFDDGMLMKIKTQWYFRIHNLRTESIFREDYVIENYYKQTLDDIMSQLHPETDKDAIDFVKKVTTAIDKYAISIDEKVEKLSQKYKKEYNENWASFATNCFKEQYFGFTLSYINDMEKYNKKKIDFILEQTYRLKFARQIVEKFKL